MIGLEIGRGMVRPRGMSMVYDVNDPSEVGSIGSAHHIHLSSSLDVLVEVLTLAKELELAAGDQNEQTLAGGDGLRHCTRCEGENPRSRSDLQGFQAPS